MSNGGRQAAILGLVLGSLLLGLVGIPIVKLVHLAAEPVVHVQHVAGGPLYTVLPPAIQPGHVLLVTFLGAIVYWFFLWLVLLLGAAVVMNSVLLGGVLLWPPMGMFVIPMFRLAKIGGSLVILLWLATLGTFSLLVFIPILALYCHHLLRDGLDELTDALRRLVARGRTRAHRLWRLLERWRPRPPKRPLAPPPQRAALNVLRASRNLSDESLTAELMIGLKRLFRGSAEFGPRMEWILRTAVRTLLASQGEKTLADIPRFLEDGTYRQGILATVTDRTLQEFWHPRRLTPTVIDPVLNRLDSFLDRPTIRAIVSQPNRIDFHQLMAEGKLFLANLDKGRLQDAAFVLGSFILSRLQLAALARPVQARPLFPARSLPTRSGSTAGTGRPA